MRRKYNFVIAVTVLMISLLAGCEKETDETVAQDSLFEEASSEHDTIQDKEISTETEETSEENDTQQADISYEMPDWLAAYVDYAEKLESEYQNANVTYSFIYVDADDIPELVIYPGYPIYHILTFHNGEMDELMTDRATVCYMEKKNLLDNYAGAMGFYHDYIYTIENGKWVYVTGGEYYERRDEINERYFFIFEWEDEEVTEDVYQEKLKEVFDVDRAIEPENFESLEGILSHLQM